MQKVCQQCGGSFEVTDDDLAFYKLVSPVIAGKKYELPPPKLCPMCRRQRRMSWRNERSLYQNTCDLTNKSIISAYSPDKPFKTYHHKDWHGDSWDPMDYGCDYDPNKSFFKQFRELIEAVPKKALHVNETMVNCDYCNYGGQSKDCYLCNVPFGSEKCFYSRAAFASFWDVDGYSNIQVESCYECISCWNCYECFFSEYCHNCQNSAFLVDCIAAKNCFGSVGLRHQEYMFLNAKLPAEEYKKKVSEILSSYKKLKEFSEYFAKWRLKFPYKYARNKQFEDCSGDLINNCKGCYFCFDIINQQDSKFCELGGEKSHHIYDSSIIGIGAVNCYEHIGSMSCNDCAFGVYMNSDINTYYSISCANCENCFGCDGLTRKQYCILNKQYSKEDYETLVPKIIEKMQADGEWGEFFPVEVSPFAYNESLAQDFFPLNKQKVEKNNWHWHENVQEKIPEEKAYQIADNVSDVSEDIVGKKLRCGASALPYQIIKQEFYFYKKHGLALPRKSPDQRYKERLLRQNPYNLWERQCAKCSKNLLSSYAPDKPEIIYCDDCYEKYYN